MRQLSRKNLGLTEKPPIKILQFGEGNFLRAFIAYAFQELNKKTAFNAGIAVVQPIHKGMVHMLNAQDGLYTLFTKGIKNGKEVEEKELITDIVKAVNPYEDFMDYLDLAKEEQLQFIVSNTTEAGISYLATDTINMRPPNSFPAKLTQLLHKRFAHFGGAKEKGLTIIPCELINYNADTLKKIILEYCDLWDLPLGFKNWVLDACTFHNTLVDRIVTGYPKDQIASYNAQLDYKDNLIVSAETFFLWVIEGDDTLKQKLPFNKTDLNVKMVDNMQPFRTRKVRILNGAHTAMVPFSLLYGNETVRQTVEEPFTGPFIHSLVFSEIIPTLEMELSELESFANDVFDRFRNPFIEHKLSSIALNSISKFKVRVLPSLLAYIKLKNTIPLHLAFSFACLIRFYGKPWDGKVLPVNDDPNIISDFAAIWTSNVTDKVVQKVLSRIEYWEEDLNKVPGLSNAITWALTSLEDFGVEDGYTNFINKFNAPLNET